MKRSGIREGTLLYTKTDPTPFTERDKESGQMILTLLGISDPALRLEALWIREDFRVGQDEVAGHAYW